MSVDALRTQLAKQADAIAVRLALAAGLPRELVCNAQGGPSPVLRDFLGLLDLAESYGLLSLIRWAAPAQGLPADVWPPASVASSGGSFGSPVIRTVAGAVAADGSDC